MADWLDYSLSDFLLFSPAAYWRLFEQMNAALWPLHPLLLAILAAAVLTAAAGRTRAGLIVGLSLALSWMLVAWFFVATYYAPINWAVSWFTPVVAAQALLVLALAPSLDFSIRSRTPWWPIILIALAFAYPVTGLFEGRPLSQAEAPGLAPDPTAILSIGLIGLARPSWRRAALFALPMIWLTLSAATLFAMGALTAWFPVMALLAAALALAQGARGRR